MFRRFLPLLLTVSLLAAPTLAVAQTIDRLFEQGNAAQAAGNYTEAEAIFRRVIRRDPNDAVAYYNLGNALYDQGKLEQAIDNFKKTLQLNPNYVAAYYNLGNALRKQGKLEQAIEQYQKVLQLDPKYTNAYTSLGNALYMQGKLEQAIDNYKKVIQLDPNGAYSYNNLGIALSAQGQLEQAIDNYEKAIQLAPNVAPFHHNLGMTLVEQGKFEQAIESYAKVLSLTDHQIMHAVTLTALGSAFQKQGKLEVAIAKYKQALALDPDHTLAQNSLREAQRLLALQRNPPLPDIDDRQYLPSAEEEPLVGVLRSTARVIAEGSEGSIIGAGWVVKRQKDTVWIVTNRHVVSDRRSQRPSDKVAVEFFSELSDEKRPRYEATIEHITRPHDPKLDLAVLKVAGVPDDIEPLKFRRGRVARNTRVLVIGHPFNVDDPWNSASGEVTNYSLNSPMLPIDATVAVGNSGGPVVDAETLEVVGMMVRIRTNLDVALDPERPSPNLQGFAPATGGVGLAYRIDVAIEQLRRWRVLQ